VPNTSDLDRALVAKLAGDAALTALMPDGVWMDIAPHGSKRYVRIRLIDAANESRFGGRAYQTKAYDVEAVALNATSDDMDAAGARIEALLEDVALPLPPDLALMDLIQLRPLRDGQHDDRDSSLHWFFRGGRYQLRASWPDSFTTPQ